MYTRAVVTPAIDRKLAPTAFLQLAAHPLRWRLLGELARSDRTVRELTRLVDQPQNLVSYHLGKLRDGCVLLQSPNGKVYQFYKPGEPLQPCAAHAAKKLLAMGMLGVAKTDIRGTYYGLRDAFQPEAPEA